MTGFLKRFLLSRGFKEVKLWEEFHHPSGLEVMIGEHEWSIEHKDEEWTEEGSLSDTSELLKIIESEMKKNKST